MKAVDEPSLCQPGLVTIGRDSRGNWVARGNTGLFGGLFAQAMKFALFESGHHPEAIIVTANIVELDMRRNTASMPPTVEASLHRNRAA
jgi:hypothetical protein